MLHGVLCTCDADDVADGGTGAHAVVDLSRAPLLHRTRPSVAARAERDADPRAAPPLQLKRVAIKLVAAGAPGALSAELLKSCLALDDILCEWRRHWHGGALRLGGGGGGGGGVAADQAERAARVAASLAENFADALFVPSLGEPGGGSRVAAPRRVASHIFVPYAQQVCTVDTAAYYATAQRAHRAHGASALEQASLNANMLYGNIAHHVLAEAAAPACSSGGDDSADAADAVDRRLCAHYAAHNVLCLLFCHRTAAASKRTQWLGCADVYGVERADAAGAYALPPAYGGGGVGGDCGDTRALWRRANDERVALGRGSDERGSARLVDGVCANFFVQRTPLYVVLRSYARRLHAVAEQRRAVQERQGADSPPTPATKESSNGSAVGGGGGGNTKLSRGAIVGQQALNRSAQWARSAAVHMSSKSNGGGASAAGSRSAPTGDGGGSSSGDALRAAVDKGVQWAAASAEQVRVVRSCAEYAAHDHELVDALGLRRDTRVEHCAAYYCRGEGAATTTAPPPSEAPANAAAAASPRTALDYVAEARECASSEHREAFRERMRAYTTLIELYKHRRAPVWLLRRAFGRSRWRRLLEAATTPTPPDPAGAPPRNDRAAAPSGVVDAAQPAVVIADGGTEDDDDDDEGAHVPLDAKAWHGYKLALLAALHEAHFGHLLRSSAGRRVEAATYALAALLAATDRDFEQLFVFCEHKIASLRYKHMYAHSEAALDELLRTGAHGADVHTLSFAYVCSDAVAESVGAASGGDQLYRLRHIDAARRRCFERIFGTGGESDDIEEVQRDCVYYFARDARSSALGALLRGDGDADDIDFLDFFGGRSGTTTATNTSQQQLCARVERQIGRFATAYRREHATKYYVVPAVLGGADALRVGGSAAFVQASTRRCFYADNQAPSAAAEASRGSRLRGTTAAAARASGAEWQDGGGSQEARAAPPVPVVRGRMLLHHRQMGRYMAQRVLEHSRQRVLLLRAHDGLGAHAAPIWAVGRIAALLETNGGADGNDDKAERVADRVHNYVRYFYRMHASEHSANVRVHEASTVARIVQAARESEARFERLVGSALCHGVLWPHYEAFALSHGASDYTLKRGRALGKARIGVARKTLADRMGGGGSGIVDVLAGDAVVDVDADGDGGDVADADVAAVAKALDARETPGVDVERDERTGRKLRYSDGYVDAQLWRQAPLRPCGAEELVALARAGGFFAPCIARILLACVDDGVHPGNRARYVLATFLYSLRYSDEQVLGVFVHLYRCDPKYADVTLETFDGATGGMAKSICAMRKSFETSGTPACQTIIRGGADTHISGYMCPFADPALDLRAPLETAAAAKGKMAPNRLRLSSKHTVDIEDVVREYAAVSGAAKHGARIDAMSKRNVRYSEPAFGVSGGGDDGARTVVVNTHSRSDISNGRVLGQKLCRATCRRDATGCGNSAAGGAKPVPAHGPSNGDSPSDAAPATATAPDSSLAAAPWSRRRQHIVPVYTDQSRRSYLFGSSDAPSDADDRGAAATGASGGGGAMPGERYVPAMRRPLHYTEYVLRQHIGAALEIGDEQLQALVEAM